MQRAPGACRGRSGCTPLPTGSAFKGREAGEAFTGHRQAAQDDPGASTAHRDPAPPPPEASPPPMLVWG